jgi:mannose-6-phosphate isomerase-like protein (cupin superfamily)
MSITEDGRVPEPYGSGWQPDMPVIPWDGRTQYEKWQAEQDLPLHKGFLIENIEDLATSRWAALGADAAFVELVGAAETNGAYVLRLAAGVPTSWEQQIIEQVYYVVSGEGVTEADGPNKTEVRWGAGSLFSIPLNSRTRHRASQDTVMYVVTTAPLVMNLFHDHDFVFGNQAEFKSRTVPDEMFQGHGTLWRRRGGSNLWKSQVIYDCPGMELPAAPARGATNRTLSIQIGENTLIAHISEFTVGTYKKCHRHGPGAHILMLGGEGYSLLWKDNFAEHTRVDWKPNSLFVPPPYWWHQHFNTGQTPARYLAIRWGSAQHPLDHSYDKIAVNRAENGDQIEYSDQDPVIHELFVAECAKRGVVVDTDTLRAAGGKV